MLYQSCSALSARCVRPSFIFAIFASGSNGFIQSVSDVRIGDGGKLTFVRKYDVDVGGKTMFWMGMVQL